MSPTEAQALFGAIGAVFGGSALKLADYFFNRSTSKDNLATELRKELREEAQGLQGRVDKLNDDVEEWKQKYYDVLGQFYAMQKDVNDLKIDVANKQFEIDRLNMHKGVDKKSKA